MHKKCSFNQQENVFHNIEQTKFEVSKLTGTFFSNGYDFFQAALSIKIILTAMHCWCLQPKPEFMLVVFQ